jgi:hypothetical protein
LAHETEVLVVAPVNFRMGMLGLAPETAVEAFVAAVLSLKTVVETFVAPTDDREAVPDAKVGIPSGKVGVSDGRLTVQNGREGIPNDKIGVSDGKVSAVTTHLAGSGREQGSAMGRQADARLRTSLSGETANPATRRKAEGGRRKAEGGRRKAEG